VDGENAFAESDEASQFSASLRPCLRFRDGDAALYVKLSWFEERCNLRKSAAG
jgi:hypothetical protein